MIQTKLRLGGRQDTTMHNKVLDLWEIDRADPAVASLPLRGRGFYIP